LIKNILIETYPDRKMAGHHWFCQPGKQIRKIPAAIKQQQKSASAPISIVLIKAYYERSISTAYLEKKNKSRAGLKAVQLQKLFLVFQKF